MDDEQDDLISERQAAEVLCIAPTTLAGWRERGEGPPYYDLPIGYRYSRAEIAAWLKARRVGGSAA
jgi:hypothetical protein